MLEYKLMNREELTDYILEFWLNWGIPEYTGTNEQLYSEIYDNLGTKEGTERELDTIRIEFESGYEEESKEYQDLDKMWNYINWYKTDFYKKGGFENER